MKLSSQYLKLGWQAFRAHLKDSMVIVAVATGISLVLVMLLVSSAFLTMKAPISGISSAVFFLIGCILVGFMLIYYMPVLFLRLYRGEPMWDQSVRIPFGKVMATALVIYLPYLVAVIISQWNNFADKLGFSSRVTLVLLLVSLALFVVSIWWFFAVGILLPLRVHDRQEQSVWQSTKEMFGLTKGNRDKLFGVDFELFIWPFAIFFAVYMVLYIALIVNLLRSPGMGIDAITEMADDPVDMVKTVFSTLDVKALGWIMGIFLVVWILVLDFILYPIMYFAHAAFYEDLCAEHLPEEEETEQPSEIIPTYMETEKAEKPVSE